MGSTLRAIILCTIGALLSIVLGSQPALAACSSNSDCASDKTCQNTAIPGIKECKQLTCNVDTDCPRDRASCTGGACRGPATGGPSGGGIPQSDVGQACGPRKIGQVTKYVGCKSGLQCVHGTCQQPPS
jgi:hypothetical protein